MAKKNAQNPLERYTPIISFTTLVFAFIILLIQTITGNKVFNAFHPVLLTLLIILSLTVLAAFLLKE